MQQIIKKYLHVNSQESPTKTILLYILVAYLFSVAIRLILWYQTASIDSYWLDGYPLPIWSPDAGLYGYYAKQLLAGHSYPFVSEYMPGHLIYFITSTFNFNIDWVMFLLPAFLSSLIVIPIILMGHATKLLHVGFFAALIGSIGINFYTRSHLGYMDTDTLNLFFPYMAIASVMLALQRRSYVWGAIFLVSLAGFYYWYHSSLVIIAALIAVALFIVPFILKNRISLISSIALIVIALIMVDSSKVVKRATDYLGSNTAIELQGNNETYHFTNTLGTVSEAIDSSIFQISPVFVGTEVYVALASIGFLLLVIARPVFLMALPMLVLGYAASVLGMRFTMFATPILAFSFVFLFYIIGNYFPNKKIPLIGALAAIVLMIYNILIANTSAAPYFFKKAEVITLKEFASINKKKDLIYSWWDYSWPLWYYIGNNNTLIDNGRHGSDTHLVSKLLMSNNQNFVANAMRYFSEKNLEGRKQRIKEVLPYVIKTENLTEIFKELNYNIPTKKRERGTYIMLHRDMLLTFLIIENFANIDLKTGKTGVNSELYISDLLKPYNQNDPIVHGDSFKFDLRSGEIIGNDGAKAKIHGVIVSQNGKIAAARQYNKASTHILIIYNSSKAIYLDTKAFGTFLVQALLLDKYDKSLFEKVAHTQSFKILKLK